MGLMAASPVKAKPAGPGPAAGREGGTGAMGGGGGGLGTGGTGETKAGLSARPGTARGPAPAPVQAASHLWGGAGAGMSACPATAPSPAYASVTYKELDEDLDDSFAGGSVF